MLREARLTCAPPFLPQVLDMSAHVVLYQFNEASQAWDKKNVEGSLFIVARSSEPKHMFVVLNRLSNEHVVEGITADFQMELTDQFLLYRNEKEEINGIWFYSPNERTEIAELMQSIVAGDAPTASAKGAPDSAADASSSGATSGGPRPPDATTANSEGGGGGGGGNVAVSPAGADSKKLSRLISTLSASRIARYLFSRMLTADVRRRRHGARGARPTVSAVAAGASMSQHNGRRI